MFELLLAMGGGGAYLPNSGPGNKTLLKGNTTLGYFGEVTAEELFDGVDIALAGPVNGDDNALTGLTWLKFIRNNRVVYYAKTYVLSKVSWNKLYDVGFVYGEQGVGAYPVGDGVDQLKLLSKTDIDTGQLWWLRIRLPEGFNADPFTSTSSSAETVDTTGSEWSDLLPKVYKLTGYGGTGEWDQFLNTDLGISTSHLTLVKETSSSNINNCGIRSSWSNILASDQTSKNLNYVWRPVLELTDVNGIPLIVTNLSDSFSLQITPPLINLQVAGDFISRLTGINTDFGPIQSSPMIKGEDFSSSLYRVNNFGYSATYLKPFTPSANLLDPVLAVKTTGIKTTGLTPFTPKGEYLTDNTDTIIPATDYGVFTTSA